MKDYIIVQVNWLLDDHLNCLLLGKDEKRACVNTQFFPRAKQSSSDLPGRRIFWKTWEKSSSPSSYSTCVREMGFHRVVCSEYRFSSPQTGRHSPSAAIPILALQISREPGKWRDFRRDLRIDSSILQKGSSKNIIWEFLRYLGCK